VCVILLPSVLWCCWLDGRKGIRPVKRTKWWDVGVVMCADLHMAQLMPLPLTISCSSKSKLVLPFWCWFTWVVPDKIQEGHKMDVCVRACMCVYVLLYVTHMCSYLGTVHRRHFFDSDCLEITVIIWLNVISVSFRQIFHVNNHMTHLSEHQQS